MWLIGDDFAFHTAQQFFNCPKANQGRGTHYSFDNFEVTEYLSSKYKSSNPSTIGRLVNNLVYGLNKHKTLPRVIVFVPDDDIVKNIKTSDVMIRIVTITEWVVKECHKAITTYKEILPDKAKRSYMPHMLWIAPPVHRFFGSSNNKKREIQAECLDKIAKLYSNMMVLKIIKHWDLEDRNSFLFESYRFTSEGLKNYWKGVDAAIRFWNVAIYPKISSTKPKNVPAKSKRSRYKWVPQ